MKNRFRLFPLTLALKRPFIWLSRFRHRCGYGVHSPFAFGLITSVIYQRTPYYKYKELEEQQKQLGAEKEKHWKSEPRKVKRLLFRLVNEFQPHTVVDAGTLAASSLYLQAAKEEMNYTAAADLSELFLESGVPVDFLYLHHYRHSRFVEEVFRICLSRTTERSVFVVEGIRYTPAMYALWQRFKQESRVGITFDLYDLGLIFFDQTKIKQDYIVNF